MFALFAILEILVCKNIFQIQGTWTVWQWERQPTDMEFPCFWQIASPVRIPPLLRWRWGSSSFGYGRGRGNGFGRGSGASFGKSFGPGWGIRSTSLVCTNEKLRNVSFPIKIFELRPNVTTCQINPWNPTGAQLRLHWPISPSIHRWSLQNTSQF